MTSEADRSKYPALSFAILDEDLSEVERLLGLGLPSAVKLDDGFEFLWMAAMSEDIRILEALLEAGFNPHVTNSKGETLLIVAAELCHPAMIALLLSLGLDVNAVDSDGLSPLLAACLSGDSCGQVVEALLVAGADASIRNPASSKTPLEHAREDEWRSDMLDAFARHGHEEM